MLNFTHTNIGIIFSLFVCTINDQISVALMLAAYGTLKAQCSGTCINSAKNVSINMIINHPATFLLLAMSSSVAMCLCV